MDKHNETQLFLVDVSLGGSQSTIPFRLLAITADWLTRASGAMSRLAVVALETKLTGINLAAAKVPCSIVRRDWVVAPEARAGRRSGP